jgi:hypothetical protein
VFHVVSQWLAWIPSNGLSIKLGEHPIVEKVNFHNLSDETLSHLHSRGIFYLAQSFVRHDSNYELSKWFKVDDLLLQGVASEKWNDYVRGLSARGICLSDQEDKIVWSWNVNDGQFIVDSTYEAMMIQSQQRGFGMVDFSDIEVGATTQN